MPDGIHTLMIITLLDMIIISFFPFLSVISIVISAAMIIRLICKRKDSSFRRKKTVVIAVISAVLALIFLICGFCIIPPPLPPPKTEAMVDLTGYDYNECEVMYSDYFDMQIERAQYSSEYPNGTIISHTPREGFPIVAGDTVVYCTVSLGSRMITVPNIISLNKDDAERILKDCGLSPEFIEEYSSEHPAGTVIRTNPPFQSELEINSTVKCVISMGEEPESLHE